VVICLEQRADCLHIIQLMPLLPKIPNFVNGHMSTMWFMVCLNHRKEIGQDPVCASHHDMGLDLSRNGSSETMYDEGDRKLAVG